MSVAREPRRRIAASRSSDCGLTPHPTIDATQRRSGEHYFARTKPLIVAVYDPSSDCPRGLGSIAVSADGGSFREPDDDEREAGTRNGHRAERTRLPSRMRAPENKIALIIR